MVSSQPVMALLLRALAAVAFAATCAGGDDPPAVELLSPHDGLSLALGGPRRVVCGGGSSALVIVRHADAAGAQLCLALAEPVDGDGPALRLRAPEQDAGGDELCLPLGQGRDISPVLPATTALAVPFAVAGDGAEEAVRKLRLRAILRPAGEGGAVLAEATAEVSVLVGHDGAAPTARCVGAQRWEEAAEIAGLYRLLAEARRGDAAALAASAAAVSDTVPHSARLAVAAAHGLLLAAQPRFLAPQWCSMLRHPGCVESQFAPAALPSSPYATTAQLVEGLRRRVSRLAAAIARARLALVHPAATTETVVAGEVSALQAARTRAQEALLDAQLVESVLAQSALRPPPPPPRLAIVFMTMRPGGYDVLLESLAQQTDARYELFCVDELTHERRSAVAARAAALGVNLIGLRPGKPRADPPEGKFRFGYANAMNTGLLGVAAHHAS